MIFRQLFDATSSTYTYLLADPVSREAVLIDPVFELYKRDMAMLREMDLKLVYTLDTHAHADHITSAWLLKRALGSKIAMSARYDAENVDLAIDHGEVLRFGERALEVRATPGHTIGCLSYVTPERDMVFTGDSLMIRGAGRTDFQEGDSRTLFRSIKEQLFTLPDDCLVYPGHDYAGRTMSMIKEEKLYNARIGGHATEREFVGYMNNLGLPHPKKLDIAVPANMRCGRPEQEPEDETPTWGPVTLNYAGIYQVEPEWVYLNQDDLYLLDVRSREELVLEGQIQGSRWILLDELRGKLEELPKEQPIIAVCHAGIRSGQATNILSNAGFSKVANLAGGLVRWRELSFPLTPHPQE